VQNTVDLESIDDESARQGSTLVDNLLRSSAPKGDRSHDRDAAEFTVTIERQGRKTVFSAPSTGLSREFAELLDWLKRHASAKQPRADED
jgi:hypothetical protein